MSAALMDACMAVGSVSTGSSGTPASIVSTVRAASICTSCTVILSECRTKGEAYACDWLDRKYQRVFVSLALLYFKGTGGLLHALLADW